MQLFVLRYCRPIGVFWLPYRDGRLARTVPVRLRRPAIAVAPGCRADPAAGPAARISERNSTETPRLRSARRAPASTWPTTRPRKPG